MAITKPRRAARRTSASRALARAETVRKLDIAIAAVDDATEKATQLRRALAQAETAQRAARKWESACWRAVAAEAKRARARTARARASSPSPTEQTRIRLNAAAPARRP